MGFIVFTTAAREREPKGRRDSGLRRDGDLSLVGLNNRAADGQPHAHPPGTRAEVRVKNPPQSLWVDALSVISDTELNTAGSRTFSFYKHRRLRWYRRRDRRECVADQVHQHLLHLDRVAAQPRQIGCQV